MLLQIMGLDWPLEITFTEAQSLRLRHACHVALKFNEAWPDDEPVSINVPLSIYLEDGDVVVHTGECMDNGVVLHLITEYGEKESQLIELGDI